jgi:hypothetical protein
LFILRITQHFRLHCRGGVARTTAFDFAGQLWLRPQRRWGRPCTRRPCRFVSSRELSATSLTWSIPDSIAALAPSRLNHLADPTGVGGLRTGSAIRRHSPHRSRSAWVRSVREDSRPLLQQERLDFVVFTHSTPAGAFSRLRQRWRTLVLPRPGLPLRPEFYDTLDRAAARHAFNLSASLPFVLVMAGAQGNAGRMSDETARVIRDSPCALWWRSRGDRCTHHSAGGGAGPANLS